MLWLKLTGALLTVIYLALIIIRFPIVLPCVTIAYLALPLVAGIHPQLQLGSVTVHGADILFLISVLNIGYRLLIDRQTIDSAARPVLLALCAYVGYLEFAEFYGYLFGENISFERFIRLSLKACYPLIVISLYLDLSRERSERFWFFVLICSGIIAVVSTLRAGQGVGFVTSSGTLRYLAQDAMLLLHFPLVYALFVPNLSRALRIILFFMSILLIVLTNARSAFLAVGAIFFVYGIYLVAERRLGRVFAANAAIILIGGTVAVGYVSLTKAEFIANFVARAGDTFDAENQTSVDRLNKWKIALETTKENLFGGTKLNLLTDYYGHRAQEAWAGALDIAEAHERLLYLGEADPWPPHNMFINMVSRNGIIAVVLFAGLLWTLVRFVSRQGAPWYRFMALSWASGNIALLQFNNHTNFDSAVELFLSLIVFPLIYARFSGSGHVPMSTKNDVQTANRDQLPIVS